MKRLVYLALVLLGFAGVGNAQDASRGFSQAPDALLEGEVIDVKDGEPVEYLIRETVWGPVLDDIDYPDGEIAVSWIAHKPEGVNLRLLDLETTTSVADALDIANTMSMPPQKASTSSTMTIFW